MTGFCLDRLRQNSLFRNLIIAFLSKSFLQIFHTVFPAGKHKHGHRRVERYDSRHTVQPAQSILHMHAAMIAHHAFNFILLLHDHCILMLTCITHPPSLCRKECLRAAKIMQMPYTIMVQFYTFPPSSRMAYIFGQDRSDPGRTWRTYPAKMAPIPDDDRADSWQPTKKQPAPRA